MKKLHFFLVIMILASLCSKKLTAQVNIGDSLALVDLYNSTNGPHWKNNANWLTDAPVQTWNGVLSVENGRVTFLLLQHNNLVGRIPTSIGTLSEVWNLDLSNNGLIDTLPTSFNTMLKLTVLDLSVNQLTGNIPSVLGNLPKLSFLDLSYNELSGTVPLSLNKLPDFSTVRFSRNHLKFSGLEGLFNTSKIIFWSYAPQADIPLITNGNIISVSAGGTLANNTYTWYKDNIQVAVKKGDSTYTISSSGEYVVDVTNSVAKDLTLYSIGKTNIQDSLALVDLYSSTNGSTWLNDINWLSKPVSEWYGITVIHGRVKKVELFTNSLSGTIPSSIGNLSDMTLLNLSSNQISGSIPLSIGNLSSVTGLHFFSNQLTGSIPTSIGNLSNITSLNLSGNQLSGAIPASLGNLSKAISIFLSGNQLSGNIPSSIGNLPVLDELDLSDNELDGNIPDSLGKISVLRLLYLSNNQLSGIIPASLARTSLVRLHLNNNNLTGNIPDSLGNLVNLFNLELQDNALSGSIPSSLGNIRLYGLRVNNNHLSGTVPASLNTIPNLRILHIQNNQFTFNGMENLPSNAFDKIYAPQASIPLIQSGNSLFVTAGGTPINDTFRLYKDDLLINTQIGDSVFSMQGNGRYYVTVTNKIANQLTLYSDTLNFGTIPISISIKKNISITEGNLGTTPAKFNISLDKPSTATVTVNYTTKSLSAKAGSDFTAKTGKLTFGNGFVNKSITIEVTGDNLVEPNERFALVLSNPVNAVLGTIDSAICIIKNDDPSFSLNTQSQENIGSSNRSVKIYPNPVKDVLNIQGLSTQYKVQLSITDVNGKVLAKKSTSNSSYALNIKTLPAGSYFLLIQSQNKYETLSFVKQ